MRIFVTGATGFVGAAVVPELVAAGHQVLGLTRSDAGASSLLAAGAQVHRGDLEDLDSLRRGAAAADGVIHTAFNHDFSKFKANCEADRQVIAALGSALAGSDRPLIITSAVGILPSGRVSTEQTMPAAGPGAHPRSASEEAADAVAGLGVRVCVVRLAASVHGAGDHGFVPMLIDLARQKGISACVGDGLNRWPAVHRRDAAQLYRLVLEKGSAGARYHGIAETGIALRDIASVIGRRLGVPVVAMSDDEAAQHFGWFVHFAAMDMPASSEQTQERLGWQPKQPGLMADLDRADYFTN
jgi:nucleoside-diphosphate-sugar epimerase